MWDLDDTVGRHRPGGRRPTAPEVLATLRALDERGILHAVASRGDHARTTAHLKALGIEELFTALEIGWGAKSDAVRHVAETVNIGIDTVAFIDNDAVERAEVADLERAHELTVRTHQLTTTCRTYDMAEPRELLASPAHRILVASLEDRFGSYGTIGLALSELTDAESVLGLLVPSCRVMPHGVGPALSPTSSGTRWRPAGRPVAEFAPTEVNRVMLVNLRFSGFDVMERDGDRILLGFDPAAPPPAQDGAVRVVIPACPSPPIQESP
ncbi:hypothetical protein [Streptomyces violascens]|uniref:hypothetical protein n=1 Tax=Streptomyces violascens TaxID=67381 RepID=UPI003680B0C4